MATTTYSATSLYTQYYKSKARLTNSYARQAYSSVSGTYTPDHMGGVIFIPSLGNVDWTTKVVQSATITATITNNNWADTYLFFWRSPKSNYENIEVTNYMDLSYGRRKIPISGGTNSTAVLTADELEWFAGALEKGTTVFTACYNDDTKEFYNLTIKAFSFTITYVDRKTLTYNANGGTGAPEANTKVGSGVATTISSTKPTRTNYTFLGWSTSSTATTATYQPGDSITITSNTTLYAVWKKNQITVSFHTGVDQDVLPDTSKKVDIGDYYDMEYYPDTRVNGYCFIGWANSPSLNGLPMYQQWHDANNVWVQNTGLFADGETDMPVAGTSNTDWYAVWSASGNVYRKNSNPTGERMIGYYNNLEHCLCFNYEPDRYEQLLPLWGISKLNGTEIPPPPPAADVWTEDEDGNLWPVLPENPYFWFTYPAT